MAAFLMTSTGLQAAIYSEDFNTDQTASWTVNDSGLSDITVDFHYDYSAIGVPAAPNGTLLNVTLIDNILVIPEPSSSVLLLLAGVGLLSRIRRPLG